MAIYTNIEAAFRKASKLMPQRLDLRFDIASCVMAQAIQTNGQQLFLLVSNTLQVYREIQTLDPNGFDAPLLSAAYSRAIGDTNRCAAIIDHLQSVYPDQTREYLSRFARLDRILQLTPREKPPIDLPRDKRHGIVVLGAGLETNGAAKAKLVGRLQQCLKLARRYRHAPVILTGGNQKGGLTEAYVMSLWLTQHGISQKRIFLEDRARDTMENALFCAPILQRLRVTHVTLVTSASHSRRGLADLEEACLQRGLKLEYETLASRKGDKGLNEDQERLGIYRDVLRISGLWAFPGLRR